MGRGGFICRGGKGIQGVQRERSLTTEEERREVGLGTKVFETRRNDTISNHHENHTEEQQEDYPPWGRGGYDSEPMEKWTGRTANSSTGGQEVTGASLRLFFGKYAVSSLPIIQRSMDEEG